MSLPESYRKVDSKNNRKFSKILKEYLNINEYVARKWQWHDAPWWYNERANLSIFAAAVWKVGGVAFEEYTSEKRTDKKSSLKKYYSGLNDLYFQLGNEEYIVEAKLIYPNGSPRDENIKETVLPSIKKTTNEVKNNNILGMKKSAVVFAIPKFAISKKDNMDHLIKRWIDNIKTINYTAAAWTFPKQARTSYIWNDSYYFPGACVIIKLLK